VHGEHTRIMLRPLASSTPLAFYAFGTGTILYTASQLQWIPQSQDKPLGVFLLAFAAPLQILAGLIAYAARDAGLATIMTIFGAAWACLGITSLVSPPGSRTVLLGIFLLTIATMVAAIGTVSVKTRPLLFGLAILVVARYALTGVYEIDGAVGLQHAAGWLGLPIVALSLYGGTAFLLEETMHRTVLPLGRRHGALDAVQAGFDDQIERLASEAGVRHQL
jgi:succinate-acetate transporter protein